VTACTIVAIPAFGQTRLALNPERESRDVAMTAAALTAAAAYQQPVYEPAMFAAADPNLLAPMRLSIDPDTGHVFGFIATWKDKHRSVGLGHIKPPRSHTNYEHFHTSPGVHLSNGTVLPVGRLTVGIGHAPTRGISSAAAQAHYDNVEACWAIGRISEHRLGIYFSGVVAPWASPEKVQMGLASPVSGDWRPVGQGNALELVAVLSVNTPGFLCKTETDASGAPLAMVASLTVADDVPVMSYSLDELKAVFAQVLAEDRAASNADRAQLVNNGVLMAPSEASLPGPQASADPAPAADDTATDTDLAPAAVDATDRMGELIAQFSGIDAPATPATPAEAAPVELTPTERMGSLISEFNGKVRDAAYWGKPVGTPITPGMKPKGRSDHDLSKASHNQLVQGLHDAEVHGDREGAAEIRAEAEKRPASKGQVSKLDADGKLQYDYGTGANAKSNERRDRILMARSAPERLSTKDLKTARTHMLADQKRMADPRFKLPGEDTSAQDKKRAQELAGVERELEARKKAPSSKSSGGSSPKA
jgi:hypothetical protein